MGSQTLDSIQQQDNMRQQAFIEAASPYIQGVEQAKAKGASLQQIQQMIGSIPAELQGFVAQQTLGGQEQNQTRRSPVTDKAQEILSTIQ
jgi:carotenoid cleavage dioxygenase-like enzyme